VNLENDDKWISHLLPGLRADGISCEVRLATAT